jgi:hypothetical protein
VVDEHGQGSIDSADEAISARTVTAIIPAFDEGVDAL